MLLWKGGEKKKKSWCWGGLNMWKPYEFVRVCPFRLTYQLWKWVCLSCAVVGCCCCCVRCIVHSVHTTIFPISIGKGVHSPFSPFVCTVDLLWGSVLSLYSEYTPLSRPFYITIISPIISLSLSLVSIRLGSWEHFDNCHRSNNIMCVSGGIIEQR